MNKLILCEGETDAILLSYYLGKIAGWKYCDKPLKNLGALETVLLDAISEEPYDKNIVEKATAFVKQMRAEASKYIGSDRLQLKAQLGVTWAVQFPEKVFSRIDEQIRRVHWEKHEVLKECFSSLDGI